MYMQKLMTPQTDSKLSFMRYKYNEIQEFIRKFMWKTDFILFTDTPNVIHITTLQIVKM